MTETVYAEHSDLRKHGLPPGVLAQQALPVSSVDTSTDTIEIADHGCAAGDPVVLSVDPGGALPSPLVAGSTYYARLVAGRPDRLQLAATVGGAAINLTSIGAGSFALLHDLSEDRSYEARRYASRQVDSYLPAEVVPFSAPIPAQVVAWTAKLSARELMRQLGRKDSGVWEMADAVLGDLSNARKYGFNIRSSTSSSLDAVGARWGETRRQWGGLP